MPIVIDGKTYRNLTEQVKKNMDDIKELQDKASGEVTKNYVDTQDEALQKQITENTTDITELKTKTQTNTTNISSLENNKQDKLTQNQLDATNSGITATKVSKYDDYENTKQGKLTAGDNITISADNVISAAGGGSGSDVTKAYVDEQDQKIKTECNKYTNDKVSEKVDEFNMDPSVVGEYTRFAYAYSYKNGTYAIELTLAPSQKVTIPLRNSQGHMLTMTMTDDMMASEENNQVITSFETLKKYTQYHYANLNITNVFPKYQQFLAPNKYSNSAQHIEAVFEAAGKYTASYQPETGYLLGTVTQTYEPTKTDFITMYFLTCNVTDGDNALRKYILTETEAGKGLSWNSNNQKLNVTYPVVKCTQSEYDALTKDTNTLYVIVG